MFYTLAIAVVEEKCVRAINMGGKVEVAREKKFTKMSSSKHGKPKDQFDTLNNKQLKQENSFFKKKSIEMYKKGNG